MDPSQVRLLIRAEHTVISARTAAIEAALDALDGAPLDAALLTQVEAFAGRLLVHMAHEEAYLVPILAESTNWGPVNIAEIRSHHDRQRADIGRVVRALSDDSVSRDETERALRALLDDVRADLRDEEAHLLTDRMLRDDVVAIDAADG